MNKTELPINRNPESDRLFRCTPPSGADVFIRTRLLEAPGGATFVNKVDRDVITLQLQSSIAADETGDVQRDVDRAHLIMSPSRHTIHLDTLAASAAAKGLELEAVFEQLLEQLIEEEVTKAYQKALARRLVLGRLAKVQVAPAMEESAAAEAAASTEGGDSAPTAA